MKKYSINTHNTFLLSIILKGLNGLIEILGALFFTFVRPETFSRILVSITAGEISEDPKDAVANYLVRLATDYSVSIQIFWAVYLFSHGLIKLVLVVSLWKKRLWAYPAAIIVFVSFIIYQIYRYSHTHSMELLILSIFDVVVVVLTVLEYRRLKNEKAITANNNQLI